MKWSSVGKYFLGVIAHSGPLGYGKTLSYEVVKKIVIRWRGKEI